MSRILLSPAFAWLPTVVCTLALFNRAAAQTVWSGFDFTFTRPDGVGGEELLPEYQDRITDNVWLTRGTTGGLFNIAQEIGFVVGTSPGGTEWATDRMIENAGQTIAAANWGDLMFTNWLDAYRGLASGELPDLLTSRNAVVHLIDEDIYLDLRFTGWTARGGGGFSYVRAANPVPEPAACVLLLSGTIAVRRRSRWRLN